MSNQTETKNKELNFELSDLQVINNQIVVSSRDIASSFEKQHKNVLRDIENVDCSEIFRKSNFGLSKYKSGRRSYKQYLISRDGFAFLVMGFTGKKAAEIKEAYINAFNAMAEKQTLHNSDQLELPDPEKFKTEKYTLINAMIQQMKLTDEPLVIPYVDLANMINTSRHIEQQTLMLIKACKNIDARIDTFKKYTGRHLCDKSH